MTKLKVMTILGTRPEIIRLSACIKACDRYFDHKLVHTGQNYDYTLNEIFFEELGLRAPDFYLEAAGANLGQTMGNIIAKSYEVLAAEKPDAVLLLGDTNSALAAISAKRLKIPIFHMEAGNRCFDLNVPEETNRRFVDHIADFNLVYTEHARRHLLAEGLPHRRIYLTGSPMREVLETHRAAFAQSDVLARLDLKPKGYLLASVHREENVDRAENLRLLLAAFTQAADEFKIPVIVSTHPRTRKRLALLDTAVDETKIRFLKPFGFHDYIKLQLEALCTISDSGTIAEESGILGFPAVTVRNAIERPEAIDTGTILVTGLQPQAILDGIKVQIAPRSGVAQPRLPAEYEINDTSLRVLKLIVGHARLSNAWDGIRPNDLT